ncbi:MAG: DUF2796 domain-containing protein [Hydrogenophilaceae bacterium]|nr:DUF2796 domain-containing protein [Hydrogenophilaceae bacterium]
MPPFPYLTIAILAAALPCASVLAAEAHVHGQAHLAIAVDGGSLTLMLESPTDSLVGFEHAPRNAKERAAVAKMKQVLEQAGELFKPSPAANCKPAGVKLESPLLEAGHGAAGKDDHGHAGHADLDAEFMFQCAQPGRLRDLEVLLFDRFPGMKTLNVEVAGPKGQKAVQLNPRQRKVSW